jgi:putative ATP-binding cassette transporter
VQLTKLLFTISKTRIVAVFAAGLISGVANTYLLTLIGGVLSPEAHHGATWQRFAVTGSVALVSTVVSQLLLIRLTQDAIYQLRTRLSSGVVSAPLEHLERLGAHRLLATLTEDVRALSQAVTSLPNICVDAVTILGCFMVLALVSGPIFAVTATGTALSILGVEMFLRRVRRLYRQARENEDALLRSFQSGLAGIKELKLHRGQRRDYMDRHLLGAAGELRDKNVAAGSRFSVAHGYGRALQLLTMAVILFVLTRALELPRPVMVTYILVTIFLAMPMQSFMSRIPELLRGDVALAKIRAMNLSVQNSTDEQQLPYTDRPAAAAARLELTNLSYTYPTEPAPPHGPGTPPHSPHRPPPGQPLGVNGSGFRLGPLDLVFEPGQISFVVGGNGSGKSTQANLLTGLYLPETGFVTLNGEKIGHDNLEWFRQNCSAVFTDFHLFKDYLGFDRPGIDDEVRHLLTELQLTHKVTVQDGRLSTVALSQGQRKRLALLTTLLEDRPIYVFDEWAADQEPRFRDVFYTEIVTGLARRGKTVIVITHDDRYFHCADQIIELDFGQLADTSPPTAAIDKSSAPPLRFALAPLNILERSCAVSAISDEGRNLRALGRRSGDHAPVADRVLFRSLMSDNLRWDALELREGDIVISAPSKCGMTWTQRLVSLLVFDGPDLPEPMSRVSPWLDQTIRPIEEVVAALDAQKHRRFIKTHTPLDGLVLDDRVTYIGVGRDPRDVAVSMLHQEANTDPNRRLALHDAAAPPHKGFAPPGADFPRGVKPHEAVRDWMERPVMPAEGMGSLATILYHFGTVWQRRHLPNVAVFHYADYRENVASELVRLGRVLGYDVGRARAEELVKHASLDAMRARASELAPNSTEGIWRSNERFFRAGGLGEWRDIFTEHELQRYFHRVEQLAPPDLVAWAHDGRRGCDPGTATANNLWPEELELIAEAEAQDYELRTVNEEVS